MHSGGGGGGGGGCRVARCAAPLLRHARLLAACVLVVVALCAARAAEGVSVSVPGGWVGREVVLDGGCGRVWVTGAEAQRVDVSTVYAPPLPLPSGFAALTLAADACPQLAVRVTVEWAGVSPVQATYTSEPRVTASALAACNASVPGVLVWNETQSAYAVRLDATWSSSSARVQSGFTVDADTPALLLVAAWADTTVLPAWFGTPFAVTSGLVDVTVRFPVGVLAVITTFGADDTLLGVAPVDALGSESGRGRPPLPPFGAVPVGPLLRVSVSRAGPRLTLHSTLPVTLTNASWPTPQSAHAWYRYDGAGVDGWTRRPASTYSAASRVVSYVMDNDLPSASGSLLGVFAQLPLEPRDVARTDGDSGAASLPVLVSPGAVQRIDLGRGAVVRCVAPFRAFVSLAQLSYTSIGLGNVTSAWALRVSIAGQLGGTPRGEVDAQLRVSGADVLPCEALRERGAAAIRVLLLEGASCDSWPSAAVLAVASAVDAVSVDAATCSLVARATLTACSVVAIAKVANGTGASVVALADAQPPLVLENATALVESLLASHSIPAVPYPWRIVSGHVYVVARAWNGSAAAVATQTLGATLSDVPCESTLANCSALVALQLAVRGSGRWLVHRAGCVVAPANTVSVSFSAAGARAGDVFVVAGVPVASTVIAAAWGARAAVVGAGARTVVHLPVVHPFVNVSVDVVTRAVSDTAAADAAVVVERADNCSTRDAVLALASASPSVTALRCLSTVVASSANWSALAVDASVLASALGGWRVQLTGAAAEAGASVTLRVSVDARAAQFVPQHRFAGVQLLRDGVSWAHGMQRVQGGLDSPRNASVLEFALDNGGVNGTTCTYTLAVSTGGACAGSGASSSWLGVDVLPASWGSAFLVRGDGAVHGVALPDGSVVGVQVWGAQRDASVSLWSPCPERATALDGWRALGPADAGVCAFVGLADGLVFTVSPRCSSVELPRASSKQVAFASAFFDSWRLSLRVSPVYDAALTVPGAAVSSTAAAAWRSLFGALVGVLHVSASGRDASAGLPPTVSEQRTSDGSASRVVCSWAELEYLSERSVSASALRSTGAARFPVSPGEPTAFSLAGGERVTLVLDQVADVAFAAVALASARVVALPLGCVWLSDTEALQAVQVSQSNFTAVAVAAGTWRTRPLAGAAALVADTTRIGRVLRYTPANDFFALPQPQSYSAGMASASVEHFAPFVAVACSADAAVPVPFDEYVPFALNYSRELVFPSGNFSLRWTPAVSSGALVARVSVLAAVPLAMTNATVEFSVHLGPYYRVQLANGSFAGTTVVNSFDVSAFTGLYVLNRTLAYEFRPSPSASWTQPSGSVSNTVAGTSLHPITSADSTWTVFAEPVDARNGGRSAHALSSDNALVLVLVLAIATASMAASALTAGPA